MRIHAECKMTVKATEVCPVIAMMRPRSGEAQWMVSEIYVGGRWYTFDATQSKARGGRIVIVYGRDAADVAFLSNYGPLELGDMTVTVHRVDPEP